VAFPFFKKKETVADTRVSAASSSAQKAREKIEPPRPQISDEEKQPQSSGIEVINSGELLSAAEEHAAILHANNASAQAIESLVPELERIRSQRHQQSWLMLFELYQQEGNQTAHEALGLEYVLEFEKTPPIWSVSRGQQIKQVPITGNNCVFGRRLSTATLAIELQRLRQNIGKGSELRLDFSQVEEIDALAAAEILAAWHMARKGSSAMRVVGGSSFGKLLADKIETGRSHPAEAPFWLLLIDIYQAMGQQDAFENLAVEYAITFEVSPPSWDEQLTPPATSAEPCSATSELPSASEGFYPPGNITSQHPDALAEIREYAQRTTGPLVLDLDAVDRIDFESAGLLLNLCMELLQAGRTIRLIRVNELVFALLQLMGITEIAAVERRKS